MEATSSPRSRRALLAAAIGGLAAVAAQALGRPAPSRAAPSYVVLGGYNSEATRTTIENLGTGTTATATALRGKTNAAGGTAAGVEGLATDAMGVQGKSTNWIGVNGESGAYIGVSGYGEWVGVVGQSTNGRGVVGSTDSGTAGYFSARTGRGVYAAAGATGTALQVSGVARFSRSGKLTIPAGETSVTKVGVPLGSDSLVLAVLQQDRPGVWVRAVVPDPAADQFTIRLNSPVIAATGVAWFVIG